jgi:hypothetical protein
MTTPGGIKLYQDVRVRLHELREVVSSQHHYVVILVFVEDFRITTVPALDLCSAFPDRKNY